MPPVPRVKICCIASLAEARLALDHGAAALGLVSAMPSGPGVIADDLIAEIARALPGTEPQTFLLTAKTSAPAIAAQHTAAGTVKELGGTGRTHDWALSRRIRDAVFPLPLWLAGGLRAHNVAGAIAAVQPYGLDLCTGVRTEGQLDAHKLAKFMAAVYRSPLR